MNSGNPPQLPEAPGLVRLATAGLADPLDPRPGAAPHPTDCILHLGPPRSRPFAPDLPAPRALRILAAGTAPELDTHPLAPSIPTLRLPQAVLLPGLVNTHTHLDLTHLGPIPHDPDEGFVAWVDRVRAGRAQTADDIAKSVRLGIRLSLRAGVALVGDIAGAPKGFPRLEPVETLAASPLRGISFLEFFAMGSWEPDALVRLDDALGRARRQGLAGPDLPLRPVRLGLQPHAPNTVSSAAYRRAVALAADLHLPLATHLAESPEERRFVAEGAGPQREMLERFGFWTDDILRDVAQGRTPVEHLAPVLSEARFLLAHVNDLGPDAARALDTLAAARASVAYCPRASAYFGAPAHFGPHRYLDMLRAGVNVCLGTDSILNLPPGVDLDGGPGLSVLDEARLLHRRDAAGPDLLLRMCTVNGARALGWPAAAVSLSGDAAPLALTLVDVSSTDPATDPFRRALASDAPARLLALNDESTPSPAG